MDKLILIKSFEIYGVFFILSAVLAIIVHRCRPKTENKMNIWTRIISWACLVPVLIFSAYFGLISFTMLIALMIGLGIGEFLSVIRIHRKGYVWLAYGVSALIVLSAFFNMTGIFFSLPVVAVLFLMVVPVFTQNFQNTVYESAGTLLGILYVSWLFGFLILVRHFPNGFGYIVFIGTLAAAEDNIAYGVGKIFGKGGKKLIPAISPNKTVIGSVGGVIGTVLVAWLFRFAVPDLSLSQSLLLGFVISLTGQIGDLVISAVKRDMGVKDMGALIPGHGGILDRFDSWVFSAPFVYYIVKSFL